MHKRVYIAVAMQWRAPHLIFQETTITFNVAYCILNSFIIITVESSIFKAIS